MCKEIKAMAAAVILAGCLLAFACSPEDTAGVKQADEKVTSALKAVDTQFNNAELSESNLSAFVKKDNTKFRIAVMQSGEYFSYADVFEGIVQGLMTIGWIREKTFDYSQYTDGKTVLNILLELQKYDYSDYLELSPRYYFDLKWAPENARGRDFRALTGPAGKVDLIISLGTQVSVVLATPDQFSIPVMVDSISDPVGSHILKSMEDSGKDYLTGIVDPEQDLRQVKLFSSVIGFKTLGLVYEDSEIGRQYAAYDDVMKVAREQGFKVVGNTHVLPDPENENDDAAWARCEAQYVKALKELAPRVDAVYLAVQAGLSEANLPNIVAVLNQYKIPSFIMEGKNFVKNGILLGESDSNLLTKGIYSAKKIVRIFQGVKPRLLKQVFEHVPHIAINLDTAARIGFDVPIDILATADEIYKTAGKGDNQ
jgi:ABC-type uncharacterized transport system substrate-binding protein